MDFKQPQRQMRRQTRQSTSPASHPPLTVPHPIPKRTPEATPTPPPASQTTDKKFVARSVLFQKRSLIIIGVATLLIVAFFVWHYTTKPNHSQAIHDNTPAYQTISPSGRSVNELGGWRRVSPPNSQPVYAYDDSIGGVSISVSQQPLPESFTTDINGKIAQLAKSYNASNKLTTGDTTVYIGTSAKGPQSVIFTKDKLLVLIKSQSVINSQSWKQYIADLIRSGTDVSSRY